MERIAGSDALAAAAHRGKPFLLIPLECATATTCCALGGIAQLHFGGGGGFLISPTCLNGTVWSPVLIASLAGATT